MNNDLVRDQVDVDQGFNPSCLYRLLDPIVMVAGGLAGMASANFANELFNTLLTQSDGSMISLLPIFAVGGLPPLVASGLLTVNRELYRRFNNPLLYGAIRLAGTTTLSFYLGVGLGSYLNFANTIGGS